MKMTIARIFVGLIATVIAMYAGDYLFWQYKIVHHEPYGTVTVQFYYAIQEKTGKTEYDFQPPQQETCVTSMFPHDGHPPCWYERRHKEKAIRI